MKIIVETSAFTLDQLEAQLISDIENYPNETGYYGIVAQELINKLREMDIILAKVSSLCDSIKSVTNI